MPRRVTTRAVRSYRTFSPLPRKTGRFVFCGTFRRLAPPRCYLALCPSGARTFLPLARAIAWPTPGATLTARRPGRNTKWRSNSSTGCARRAALSARKPNSPQRRPASHSLISHHARLPARFGGEASFKRVRAAMSERKRGIAAGPRRTPDTCASNRHRTLPVPAVRACRPRFCAPRAVWRQLLPPGARQDSPVAPAGFDPARARQPEPRRHRI